MDNSVLILVLAIAAVTPWVWLLARRIVTRDNANGTAARSKTGGAERHEIEYPLGDVYEMLQSAWMAAGEPADRTVSLGSVRGRDFRIEINFVDPSDASGVRERLALITTDPQKPRKLLVTFGGQNYEVFVDRRNASGASLLDGKEWIEKNLIPKVFSPQS